MADATLETLKRILDSDEYQTIPDVPLFDEHDEYDERKTIRDPETGKEIPNPNFGNLLRRYGKEELQEIVENCNRRANDTGNLLPFGPGHLIPDKYENGKLVEKTDERKQPPVWGAYSNFRVGRFGPKQKLAILADQHVRKDKIAEARDYPHRSIELWVQDRYADWVAHLKRSPKQDLGLVIYQANRRKVCYSMDAYDPTNPPDVSIQPPVESGAPEGHKEFMEHMSYAFPHMKAMHEKFAGEWAVMPEHEKARYAAGPGIASSTSGFVPSTGKEKLRMEKTPDQIAAEVKSAADAMSAAEKQRMDKAENDLKLARYEKEVEGLKAEVAVLKETNVKKDQEAKLARYERDLSQLIAEGYELTLADEMGDVADFTPERFAKHVERIKKCYKRVPTGAGQQEFLPVLPGDVEGTGDISKEEQQQIISFATKNGIGDFTEARAKMRAAK